MRDGAALAAAARGGDPDAQAVFDWAAGRSPTSSAGSSSCCDPEAVVIGGGLARAYDLLEHEMVRGCRPGCRVARSVLGDQAVVAGAVLAASSLVEGWLTDRLARA